MSKKIQELWKLVCKGEISFEKYQKSYNEAIKKTK